MGTSESDRISIWIRITVIIRIRIPKRPNGLDMKDYMLTLFQACRTAWQRTSSSGNVWRPHTFPVLPNTTSHLFTTYLYLVLARSHQMKQFFLIISFGKVCQPFQTLLVTVPVLSRRKDRKSNCQIQF
jgi:hypothetical protein